MTRKTVLGIMFTVFLATFATSSSIQTVQASLPYELLWTFTEASLGDCPPTVADIDGDGGVEIILGDFRYGYTKSAYCLDEDGNIIWKFDAGGGEYAGVHTWSPDVADIDNDGELETVVVSSDRSGLGNNRIIALNSDGTELWQHVTSNHQPTAPRIADINNDGQMEIVGGEGVGAYENGRVYALGNTGNELWSYNCGRYVHVDVADINNDGKIEVIVTSRYLDNHLYVFNGFGNVIWSRSIDSPWRPAIGDINNDGFLEVVIGYNDPPDGGGVQAFDAFGNTLWTFDVEPCYGSPAVADMNNDGAAEVVAVCGFYSVYVLDGMSGSEINSYNPDGNGRSGHTNPVVADLDGDGRPEVVGGNMDGDVYCLSNDLEMLWTYSIGRQVTEVTAADINADGKMEVLAGVDKLYALGGTPVEYTRISGMITTDTTWTLAGSPYLITGDTLIDVNVTLTIEAGVVVKFARGTNLFVDGKLIANGEEEHPITFTSVATTPVPNDWGSIKFRTPGVVSTLKWTSISYATDGITVNSGAPTITNCSITDNHQFGIYVSAGAPTITDTTISNNGKDGIWNYVGDITITNSTISNNERHGIYKDSKTITIHNSVISNNSQSGIYGGAGGALTIYGCKVSHNGHDGVTICYSDVTITNSEITYNNQDGVHMASGTLSGSATITKTTISNNNGNGVYKSSGSMQLRNNTIQFNNVGIAATPFKLVSHDSFQEKSGDTTIVYNNIINNTLYSVENIGPGTNIFGTALNLVATYNWWGTTNTTLIDQLIRDLIDDFNLGRVEYIPFLTEPNPEAPVLQSVPVPDPKPIPTYVSISVDASSTFVDSTVNVNGKLTDVNGIPLQDKLITLLYSSSGNDWVTVGSATTNTIGDYNIPWVNTESGTFTLRAEWEGNDNYLGASAKTTFIFIQYPNPYPTQNNIFIESNSTLSELAFDSNNAIVNFTVSGPAGTTGYIKATIPKEVLSTEGEWTVHVDGQQVTPTINEDTNNTYLYITYGHSVHTIEIIGTETIPEYPTLLALNLLLIAITLITICKRRLFKTTTK